MTEENEVDPIKHRIAVWLDEVMKRSGLSLRQISKQAGVDVSSLSRARDLDAKQTLSFRSVEKIAAATGVPAPRQSVAGFGETDAVPWEGPPNHKDRLLQTFAGNRQNVFLWTASTSVLELAGILPGDTLIVDQTAEPVAGDLVIAQLYDWERGTARTVLRQYDPPFLLTRCMSAEGRRPTVADTDAVQIKGVVTEVVRERVHAQAS